DRNSRERDDAVRPQHTRGTDHDGREADRFQDDVELSGSCGESLERLRRGRHVGSADRPDEPRLVTALRLSRIDDGLISMSDEHHRAEQPYRTRSKDQRALWAWLVEKPIQNRARLSGRFGHHGQWFDQDGHISERRWDLDQILLVVDGVLRQKAVSLLDSALRE